jgi:hypothetical protein
VAKNSCGIFQTNCYIDAIMQATMEKTPTSTKLQQAEAAFAQLIAEASRRGFYGTAGLTLSIQDGTIQHVRVAMERMIK